MSAAEDFNNFRKFLNDVLVRDPEPGKQHRGLLADGLVENRDELLAKFDRKSAIQDLKEAAQKKTKISNWVPATARIDYMSASERDMRLRIRNRVQAMRLVNRQKAANGLTEFVDAMTAIESS